MTLVFSAAAAPPKPKAKPVAVDSAAIYQAIADAINGTFHYQQGHLVLPGGVGKLAVPRGFRYLDSTQSGRMLNKLWHNRPKPTWAYSSRRPRPDDRRQLGLRPDELREGQ